MRAFRRASLLLAAPFAVLVALAPTMAASAAATISATGTGSIVAAAASSPVALTATAKPTDVIFTPSGTRAFVANDVTDTISVIQESTDTQIVTIPLQHEPGSLAMPADGSVLYAATYSNTAYAIDPVTFAVTALTLPVSIHRIAVSPDGSRLYGLTSNTVEVMTSTGASIASIPAGFANGTAIVVSPDGSRVYASSILDDKIVVINTATNTIVTTITGMGSYPTGMTFSRDGKTLYVANQLGGGTLAIIDTATNTVTDSGIPAGPTATEVAVSPDQGTAYVVNRGGTLTVVDLSTNQIVTTLPTGPESVGIAMSPDGTRLYTANANANNLSAFDVTELSFTGPASVAHNADASFDLTLTNGNSPVADYTAGAATVDLVDSSNTVLASSAAVSPDLAGHATAVVPTAGLPAGSYTVIAMVTMPGGTVVARASGFTVGPGAAAPALAATGSDVTPTLATGLLLLTAGLVLTALAARTTQPRHRTSR